MRRREPRRERRRAALNAVARAVRCAEPMSSIATSSVSAPPLSSSRARDQRVEQLVRALAPVGLRGDVLGDQGLQADPSPRRSGPVADAALDDAVGVQQQRPARRADRARVGCQLSAAEPDRRAAAGARDSDTDGCRRSAPAAGGRRASSSRWRAPGSISSVHSVVNSCGSWRSCSSTRSQRAHGQLAVARPQTASARHAARRQTPIAASSGPWPQTSPTSSAQTAVGCLDDVEEVAAEQRAVAPGAVAARRPTPSRRLISGRGASPRSRRATSRACASREAQLAAGRLRPGGGRSRSGSSAPAGRRRPCP